MATTQLTLYNGALRELGERKLASLSEDRKPRRLLDDVWDGALKATLEEADWKFAMRAAKLIYEPSFTPSFGFTRQFSKPDDFVRLSRMCVDERMYTPLTDYMEEAGFWFADLDDLYVGYVSNGASYGGDMTLWPESFVKMFELYLASSIVLSLEQSVSTEEALQKKYNRAKTEAKSKDAQAGPTQFFPAGSWTRSRSQGRSDRGNRGSLIG